MSKKVVSAIRRDADIEHDESEAFRVRLFDTYQAAQLRVHSERAFIRRKDICMNNLWCLFAKAVSACEYRSISLCSHVIYKESVYMMFLGLSIHSHTSSANATAR